MKRLLFGLLGVLVLLVISGSAYQYIATLVDRQKYPPIGNLIDIGGYRLHLSCMGEGSPVVVLEAGLGGGALDWTLVQPEVSTFTRVCSYDRAGMAWSDRGPPQRTGLQIAKELHALLNAADVPSPYILVGHSTGGLSVQLYAASYATEVAGMVLVDSSHEDQRSRQGHSIPSFVPPLMRALAPLGIGRVINATAPASPNLPTEVDAERDAVYSSTKSLETMADEMDLIPTTMTELRETPMHLGDKPLIVLSHGLTDDGLAVDASHSEVDISWTELQADLVRRSSSARQVIAKASGHYIQFYQPRLVIDAIHEVVENVRKQ